MVGHSVEHTPPSPEKMQMLDLHSDRSLQGSPKSWSMPASLPPSPTGASTDDPPLPPLAPLPLEPPAPPPLEPPVAAGSGPAHPPNATRITTTNFIPATFLKLMAGV